MADPNNAVVWMVSIRPAISKSSILCNNPLVTITSASISIGIAVTFRFYSFFFQFLQGLCIFALLQFCRSGKFQYLADSFYLLNVTRSGCMVDIT